MRVGMAGLAARYWPFAIARKLKARRGVGLLAAATLGEDDETILKHLGASAPDFAEELGVRLYVAPEEMIEREGLDAVVLCTRHTEHAAWSERLAELGVDICIPKTFATSVADAGRIVRAGRRNGVAIAAGPSARFLPAIAAAKKAVTEGRIGEPFAMRVCHHHGTIDAFPEDDWYREAKEGGPELSLGWYVIDLVLNFMGAGIETVFAEYANYSSPGSPFMDCGKLVMRMAGGAMASCDMYFCNRTPYPSWELEVAGPRGVVRVHPSGGSPRELAASLYTRRGRKALSLPRRTRDWEIFWVDDLLKKRPPALPAEEAALITRISLAARDSARRGLPVVLAAH